MRQLDERQRRQRLGSARTCRSHGTRCDGQLVEFSASIARLLAAESGRHRWQWVSVLLRNELVATYRFGVGSRKARVDSDEGQRQGIGGQAGEGSRHGCRARTQGRRKEGRCGRRRSRNRRRPRSRRPRKSSSSRASRPVRRAALQTTLALRTTRRPSERPRPRPSLVKRGRRRRQSKAKPAPVKEVAEKSATKTKAAAPHKSEARKKKKAAKPRPKKVAAAPATEEQRGRRGQLRAG